MPRTKFTNESTYKNYLESGKESEFDHLFDMAAQEALKSFVDSYPMYIGSKAIFAKELLEERSPIDNNIKLGSFQKGGREHAQLAIFEAQKAFNSWRAVHYADRASIFVKAANILSKRKFAIAAVLSYENGNQGTNR